MTRSFIHPFMPPSVASNAGNVLVTGPPSLSGHPGGCRAHAQRTRRAPVRRFLCLLSRIRSRSRTHHPLLSLLSGCFRLQLFVSTHSGSAPRPKTCSPVWAWTRRCTNSTRWVSFWADQPPVGAAAWPGLRSRSTVFLVKLFFFSTTVVPCSCPLGCSGVVCKCHRCASRRPRAGVGGLAGGAVVFSVALCRASLASGLAAA